MPELWMPGATKDPQPNGVRLNTALPPRGTWHITADRLDEATFAQPPFANVEAYLKRVQYCPTIMLDPFTGQTKQYYPADLGARALTRWNEDGKVNLQVEIYFSPGVVRDGKKYLSVDQTPCKGIEEVVAWMESWGVPRVWPLSLPSWDPEPRTEHVWNTQAGHYGHSQVPGENHHDPGPMPSFAKPASAPRLLIDQLGGLSA